MGNLNKKANWAIGLSVVAIILSGVMLIMWFCNAGGFKAVELDTFVGVIVALLAIIVTIAIGWQIFNIYEVRSQLGNIRQLKKELDHQQECFERMELRTAHLHAITLSYIAMGRKEYCDAFRYLMEAVHFSLQHPSMPNIESILMTMEEDCIPNIEAGTIVDSEHYDKIIYKNKQITNMQSFSCIKQRYNKIYNAYIKKICVDDSQK